MFIHAMFRVAGTLSLLAAFLGFIGFAVIVLLGPKGIPEPSLSIATLLGLAASVFFSELWNLFLPMHSPVAWVLVIVCSAILGLRPRTSVQTARRLGTCFSWIPCLLGVAFLFVISISSLMPICHFDTGLYHLNAIRWIDEHQTPPGLANLHTRLGYNQSFFILVALLDNLLAPAKAHQIANGLVVWVSGLVLLDFVRPGLQKPALTLSRNYAVLLLPIMTFAGAHIFLSSAGPDACITALAGVSAFSFFVFLAFLRASDKETSLMWAVVTVFCCVLLVKFKLSYLVFGGLILALAFLLLIFKDKLKVRRDLIALVCLSGVLFAPWLARGYLTSGYPLFPATVGGLPVDWKVPTERADLDRQWIYSWARIPDVNHPPWEVLGNYKWIPEWIKNNAKYISNVRAFILICVGLICFTQSLLIRSLLETRLFQLAIILPVLAALLFWFFTAPDPRFAQGIFWIAGLNLIFTFLFALDQSGQGRTLLFSTTLSVLLIISEGKEVIPGIAYQTKLFPQKIEHPLLVPKVTRRGATVLVPGQGEQTWDSPLPSTPNQAFNPDLEMRGPKLDDGFRTHPEASKR
jgi:hypothetical protein